MINNYIQSLISTIKKTFVYSGRASRFEFWSFAITALIVEFILAAIAVAMGTLAQVLGAIFGVIFLLVFIALLLTYIACAVRRLHDVDLSGFWLIYLSPAGLPVIYVIYLLGIDSTCDKFIEKNNKIGSCWLGWILTLIFWGAGSAVALLLLFLYEGTKGENLFGPCTCAPAK